MKQIRDRRLEAGLTQTELARRSGISQPNIATYETGRRSPTEATLARLIDAMRPLPGEAVARSRVDILAILRTYNLTNPRIFGSIARGQDTTESDVDLLVDVCDCVDLLDIIDACDELETLLGYPVDLVTSRSLHPGHTILETAVTL